LQSLLAAGTAARHASCETAAPASPRKKGLRHHPLSCILIVDMALETSFQRFSLFALLAQMGNDEPPPSGMKRKTHWVGQKTQTEQKQEVGGEGDGGRPKKKDERGYRQLSSITLNEVNAAYKYYADQFLTSPAPGWIAPNYFCMIHLLPKRDNYPPVIFGRVQTTYPSDGYLQNIQELELRLPTRDHAPDLVHLRAHDVLNTPSKPLQSFCVRVKFFLHPDDRAGFGGHQIFSSSRVTCPNSVRATLSCWTSTKVIRRRPRGCM
jgi:hypothetical protein